MSAPAGRRARSCSWTTVDCPTCGRAAGQRCVTAAGAVASASHHARRARFRDHLRTQEQLSARTIGSPVLAYTATQLEQEMASRFGDELSIRTAARGRNQVAVTITHTPSGVSAEAVDTNAFRARRAAYARLLRRIYPDGRGLARPHSIEEVGLLIDLVYGEHPDIHTVGDLRMEASRRIRELRRRARARTPARTLREAG